MREPPLAAAIRAIGSAAALARALGIKPQAVSQWNRVPLERLLDVEIATGLSRAELRPDLFDNIPPVRISMPQAVAADAVAV